MAKTCYLCRGTIEQRNLDVDFRWGNKLKMIRSVPASVCRQYGERYFDASMYKAMEKLARSRRKPGNPGGHRRVGVPCGVGER